MAEVLQNDDNFFVATTEWRGERALLKRQQPTTPEARKEGFQNEILGMQAFRALAVQHPEWKLVIPAVYMATETEMIREFIEGDELLKEGVAQEQAVGRLKQLARILAGIDEIAPDLSQPEATKNSAPYNNIRLRFEAWSQPALKAGILSNEQYAAANALIDEYQPHLTARYAHGDMSPFNHVFMQEDGKLGLIDFEHYSAYKPRFYDICYAYTRTFTQADNPALAGTLLREFTKRASDIDDRQLLAVMTQRAIGMHFDALHDATPDKNYTARAQEILRLCLLRNIEALIEL